LERHRGGRAAWTGPPSGDGFAGWRPPKSYGLHDMCPGRFGLSRSLTKKLRTERPMRQRRRRPDRRRVHLAVAATSISSRPAEVLSRGVLGHWEGDLIVGRAKCSAIGTLLERHSRYMRLLHLPAATTPRLCTPPSRSCSCPCPVLYGSALPGSKVVRWGATPNWPSCSPPACTSLTPRAPGKEAPTARTSVLPQGHRPLRLLPRTPTGRQRRLNNRLRKILELSCPAAVLGNFSELKMSDRCEDHWNLCGQF
jgi:hypothetical protein